MTEKYVVFWKTAPGQQVTTVVDAHNQPVLRDEEYLETNDISICASPSVVFTVLDLASGEKYAVRPELARATLGWDV